MNTENPPIQTLIIERELKCRAKGPGHHFSSYWRGFEVGNATPKKHSTKITQPHFEEDWASPKTYGPHQSSRFRPYIATSQLRQVAPTEYPFNAD